MINVTLYTKTGCHLCEEVEKDLQALQETHPHKLAIVDIDSDPALQSVYALDIPVVEVGPYKLKAPITRAELQMTIGAASDRKGQLERINDKAYQVNTARADKVDKSDRISYWISRHYLAVINVILILYVGLPFLAPAFKQIGWNVPAEAIYKIYSPLCHQWAFRSWFLFGEQAYYPHEAAGIEGVTSFEEATGISDQTDPSRLAAREYEGAPLLGYKVALCERDIAIWGALALFGLFYAATGRRLPKLHWILWILLGIVPAGLDGFSQLLSQIPVTFIQDLLPYRESTPFLRSLTGFLFGISTAWFMFPLMEESMAESRRLFAKKFAIHKA